MPTRILRSETGFQPLEAFGFSGAFSKPGMAFCCAYTWGNPSEAAAIVVVCRNERRDRLVVSWESFFIVQFCVYRYQRGTRRKNSSFISLIQSEVAPKQWTRPVTFEAALMKHLKGRKHH